MEKTFEYECQGSIYPVIVSYRSTSRVRYTFKRGVFRVSAPYFTSKKFIVSGLDKFACGLIKSYKSTQGYDETYCYIFGVRVNLFNRDQVAFSDGKVVKFSSANDLYKKLKPIFLDTIVERVRYYEKVMNTKKHIVKVRNMTTRLGTNSKSTNTLTFALNLVHHSIEVIDSVVIHELAHDYYFDHSKKFYDVVYKYCPNYKALRKKILKGDF